jgi:hypothetical protein
VRTFHYSTELLGLFWTLSIVLYVEDIKYHNVSETGSVSVLRWMGQDKPTQLGPLERASLNHWTNPRCGILSSTYKTMDIVQNKPNSSVQHAYIDSPAMIFGQHGSTYLITSINW